MPAQITNSNSAAFNSVFNWLFYFYVKLFSCTGYEIVTDILPLLFLNSDKLCIGHVIRKI